MKNAVGATVMANVVMSLVWTVVFSLKKKWLAAILATIIVIVNVAIVGLSVAGIVIVHSFSVFREKILKNYYYKLHFAAYYITFFLAFVIPGPAIVVGHALARGFYIPLFIPVFI